MALQSTYTGVAPASVIACATACACANARPGGKMENTISASETSAFRSGQSSRPACSDRPRVCSLLPLRQVRTLWPCSRSARPTPWPMSPGMSIAIAASVMSVWSELVEGIRLDKRLNDSNANVRARPVRPDATEPIPRQNNKR